MTDFYKELLVAEQEQIKPLFRYKGSLDLSFNLAKCPNLSTFTQSQNYARP